MLDQRSDSELVLAARGDDPGAYGQLFERWFDRSWNVARTILRNDDLAADVAQDAMLAAWQKLDQLNDPEAFGGWLLRSTRNRALNRLAREGRSRAAGDEVVSGLRDQGLDDPVGAERQPEPDVVSEIRDRQELVWAAATALGERDVSLLDLHLRHGLSPAEIAVELGVEANAAHQQLFRLRSRLGEAVASYLLWRKGQPLCEGLAEAVSGRKAFDRSVARAVKRHQERCERCSEERSSLVDPTKLFAAVPLLLVPPHFKVQAAAALEAAGVPGEALADVLERAADAAQTAEAADAGGDATQLEGPGGEAGPTDPGSGGLETTPGSDPGATAVVDVSGQQATPSQAPAQPSAATPASQPAPAVPPQPTPQPVIQPVGANVLAPEPTPGPAAFADPAPAPAVAPVWEPERLLAPAGRTGRALALAGGGVAALLVLAGIAAFLLRDGETDLTAAGTVATEAPEIDPATQEGSADGDPAGPVSFTPSSTTESAETPTSPSVTRRSSTTRATTTSGSGATGGSTATTGETTTTIDDPTSSSTTGGTTSTTGETTSTVRDTTTSTDTTTTTLSTTTSESTTTTTTTTTTSTTTTSTTTAPEPSIDRFTVVVNPNGICEPNDGRPFRASWATSNADGIALTYAGGSHQGGPSGSHVFCSPPNQSVTLRATGPGGSVSQTAST